MKSQTPAPCSSIPVWAVTCRDYSTGNKVCWLWWQLCDDPHVYHVVPFTSFTIFLFFLFLYESQAQNHRQACECFHHELMNPQMHITCTLGVVFFHKHCKENNNNRGAQWWHLWLDRQVSPLCLHMDDIFYVISSHFSKEEGCGSFKAHMGGNTGSNLSVSTPCPICINSDVTMVSVYNGLSSTAAVRGTGTETGNAHGWKS